MSNTDRHVSRLALAFCLLPIVFIGGCTALLMYPWKTPAPQVQAYDVTPEMTPIGERWPLTVQRAQVICGTSDRLMLGVPDADGKWYALNGLASQSRKYADLVDIWKDDPDTPGLKIPMWLIDYGIERCQR